MTLVVGDGARGLPEQAPFDAINVAAATPGETLEVLARAARSRRAARRAAGGRAAAPRAHPAHAGDGFEREVYEEVRFVPLIAGEP